MSTTKGRTDVGGLIDRLAEFAIDVTNDSRVDLAAAIRADGADPDAERERVRDLLARTRDARRLAWRDEARAEQARAADRMRAVKPLRRTLLEMKAQLQELVAGAQVGGELRQQATVLWHKVKAEEVSERDLAGLLDDLECLHALEKDDPEEA